MIELKDAIERGTIYTLCNFLDVYDELDARKEIYLSKKFNLLMEERPNERSYSGST